MNMPIALRLATRQWFARPLRPILCSLAIAASVALIVCVGVAMDSLRYTLSAAIGRALGVAEVHIRPSQSGTDARVPQAILDRVRALPEVDFAAGRLHSFAALTKGDDHLWYDVLGVDLNLDEKLRPKTFRTGHTFSANPQIAENQILIDSQVAEKLSLKVGDKIAYAENDASTRTLEVVGILARPNLELLSKPTLYVSLPSLAKDMGISGEYNVIDIKLKESSGIEDFDQYAKTLGATLGPMYEVSPGTTSKANLSQFTRTLRLLLLLLSTMSAFCSALIIGTTLSVGIQERVRQFGQLRCIGASRGQLALFLLGDGAVMLVIGETLGLILGFALSSGADRLAAAVFFRLQNVAGLAEHRRFLRRIRHAPWRCHPHLASDARFPHGSSDFRGQPNPPQPYLARRRYRPGLSRFPNYPLEHHSSPRFSLLYVCHPWHPADLLRLVPAGARVSPFFRTLRRPAPRAHPRDTSDAASPCLVQDALAGQCDDCGTHDRRHALHHRPRPRPIFARLLDRACPHPRCHRKKAIRRRL